MLLLLRLLFISFRSLTSILYGAVTGVAYTPLRSGYLSNFISPVFLPLAPSRSRRRAFVSHFFALVATYIPPCGRSQLECSGISVRTIARFIQINLDIFATAHADLKPLLAAPEGEEGARVKDFMRC